MGRRWTLVVLVVSVALGCSRDRRVTVSRDDAERAHLAGPKSSTSSSVSPGSARRVPELHRAKLETCVRTSWDRLRTFEKCSADADCKAGLDGRCDDGACHYGACRSDAECGPKETCHCGIHDVPGPGRHVYSCLTSNCRLDADCGPNGFCSPTPHLQCGSAWGYQGWYCHTSHDDCLDTSDCARNGQAFSYCAYSLEAGRWVCASGMCMG